MAGLEEMEMDIDVENVEDRDSAKSLSILPEEDASPDFPEYPWFFNVEKMNSNMPQWVLHDDIDQKSRSAIEKMLLEEHLYSGKNVHTRSDCSKSGKRKQPLFYKSKRSIAHSKTHRMPWSEEEQQVFNQAREIYGNQWSKIAVMIPTRTALQVKNHATILQKKAKTLTHPESNIIRKQLRMLAPTDLKKVQPSITNASHANINLKKSPKRRKSSVNSSPGKSTPEKRTKRNKKTGKTAENSVPNGTYTGNSGLKITPTILPGEAVKLQNVESDEDVDIDVEVDSDDSDSSVDFPDLSGQKMSSQSESNVEDGYLTTSQSDCNAKDGYLTSTKHNVDHERLSDSVHERLKTQNSVKKQAEEIKKCMLNNVLVKVVKANVGDVATVTGSANQEKNLNIPHGTNNVNKLRGHNTNDVKKKSQRCSTIGLNKSHKRDLNHVKESHNCLFQKQKSQCKQLTVHLEKLSPGRSEIIKDDVKSGSKNSDSNQIDERLDVDNRILKDPENEQQTSSSNKFTTILKVLITDIVTKVTRSLQRTDHHKDNVDNLSEPRPSSDSASSRSDSKNIRFRSESVNVIPDSDSVNVIPDSESTNVRPDSKSTNVIPDSESASFRTDSEKANDSGSVSGMLDLESTSVELYSDSTSIGPNSESAIKARSGDLVKDNTKRRGVCAMTTKKPSIDSTNDTCRALPNIVSDGDKNYIYIKESEHGHNKCNTNSTNRTELLASSIVDNDTVLCKLLSCNKALHYKEDEHQTQIKSHDNTSMVSSNVKGTVSSAVSKKAAVADRNATDERISFQRYASQNGIVTSPVRFSLIRNTILKVWESNKQNYVNKILIRKDLEKKRKLGNVNDIGCIHNYLEKCGVINVGLKNPYSQWRRRTYTKKKVSIEKKTNVIQNRRISMRPKRKKEFNDDNVQEKLQPVRVRRAQPKQKAKPYDPFKLMACSNFSSSTPAPLTLKVTSKALVLMDMHAHFSGTEVIGLLGGCFRPHLCQLTIQTAVPCNSLSTGMQCEMDPVSQTEACEAIIGNGLQVVGWYHSHPTFPPNPSVRDIETQSQFQSWFVQGGAPFIGVIVNPYGRNFQNESEFRFMTICDQWLDGEFSKQPFQFDIDVIHPTIDGNELLSTTFNLLSKFKTYNYRIEMMEKYRSKGELTYLEKMLLSIKKYLLSDGGSLQAHLIEKIRDAVTKEFNK